MLTFGTFLPTILPKMYAVICKMLWEYLRYAVAIFDPRDNDFLYAVALVLFSLGFLSVYISGFQILGNIYYMQLQFWSFSELISHKLLGVRVQLSFLAYTPTGGEKKKSLKVQVEKLQL